jgi:hypothetical protein
MILTDGGPVHTWVGKAHRATTPMTMQVGPPVESKGAITSLLKDYRVGDKPNVLNKPASRKTVMPKIPPTPVVKT